MGERRSFKAHTQKTPQSPLSRLTIGTQNGMVSETPTYAASAIEIMNSLLAEEEASVSARSPIGIRCASHLRDSSRRATLDVLFVRSGFLRSPKRRLGVASYACVFYKPDINGFSTRRRFCEVAR